MIEGREMKRGIPFRLLLVLMVPGLLFISACGKGASLSEPPSSPVPSLTATPLNSTPIPTPSPTPSVPLIIASIPARQGKARPVMGVEIRGVEMEEKVIPFENGQRLSLSDSLSLEVFIVPYSPSSETDLHLFPLRGEAPVKGAQVVATPDMPEMGHPSDSQIGREVGDGDYGLPLELYMFGKWDVYVSIRHPEFNASLRLLLLVYPWKGEWP